MLKTLFAGKGNYKREEENNVIRYYYFGNLIGIVDKNNMTIELHSCGYTSNRSTTRALNDIARYWSEDGFKVIKRD